MKGGLLEMWTVYDHPRDYPQGYIARKWVIERGGERPTDETRIGTLDQIRGGFERQGLTCLPRDAQDDPKIVEVWL